MHEVVAIAAKAEVVRVWRQRRQGGQPRGWRAAGLAATTSIERRGKLAATTTIARRGGLATTTTIASRSGVGGVDDREAGRGGVGGVDDDNH